MKLWDLRLSGTLLVQYAVNLTIYMTVNMPCLVCMESLDLCHFGYMPPPPPHLQATGLLCE